MAAMRNLVPFAVTAVAIIVVKFTLEALSFPGFVLLCLGAGLAWRWHRRRGEDGDTGDSTAVAQELMDQELSERQKREAAKEKRKRRDQARQVSMTAALQNPACSGLPAPATCRCGCRRELRTDV